MSPEEFELGAILDEKTNVFNLGAIAFALLGGEVDRSVTKWEVGRELYEVASKAVNLNREERYETIEAFQFAWDKAVSYESFQN
ncbi:serine/threonine protein kinase [Bacillus sp. TS-2]|nr:serine/threonine protein kinase [Bacillus sp. TS-2]